MPARRKIEIACLAALVLVGGFAVRALLLRSNVPAGMSPEVFDDLLQQAQQANAAATTSTPAPAVGDLPPRAQHENIIRSVRDFAPQDWQEFTNFFATKAKPAIQKWCSIYGTRAPFTPDQVTITNLWSRWGTRPRPYTYLFVFDHVTMSVSETEGGPAILDYVATQTSKALTQVPSNPAPPATPSINRQEILALLKADSGKEYPANEIAITPTAYGTAMNGGVFVNIGQAAHMAYGPPWEYNIVYGPDGKVCHYCRNIYAWRDPKS